MAKRKSSKPHLTVIDGGDGSEGNDAHYYKRISVLANYIDRIDAEQLNFRRFMVRTFHGNYYTEKAVIKINPDGSLTCKQLEYAPTEQEAERIQAALTDVMTQWPKSIGARDTSALRSRLTGTVYEFYDRKDNTVRMVQERVQKKNGDKAYVAWSFWDDGFWRRMEPDGDLPLWKPKKKRKPRIMIHEGAKAAAHINQLIEEQNALYEHPWGVDLDEYDHWGMIGGALAPHRTEYEELRREKPTDVVYVCDNDIHGKAALETVSRCYGAKLKGIVFNDEWPTGWDMADPIPEHFYKDYVYTGPTLRGLMKPATYATERQKSETGKGKETIIMRKVFKEEWLHSLQPEVFIHRDFPSHLHTEKEFNSLIAPFSEAPQQQTATLLRRDSVQKVRHLQYDPSIKPGIYSGPEGSYINTYSPQTIKAIQGPVQRFLDYMEWLLPIKKDMEHMLRWCATLMARPDIKMLYGVLLISDTQGVGKSTLGEKVLAPIVGLENTSFPNETAIVKSDFNGWCAHKRLIVVHEIYAGHSTKAYDRLKTLITDDRLMVNRKHMPEYEVDSWAHLYACSNSRRALQIALDDRRWFIPEVTEALKPKEYWHDFNKWLMGEGLNNIYDWAITHVKEHGPVEKGDHAPASSMKMTIALDSLSPGLKEVYDVLNRIKEEDPNAFVLDTQLVEHIKTWLYDGRYHDRLEKPYTIRKLARGLGWHIHKTRSNVGTWNKYGRDSVMICLNKRHTTQAPANVAKAGGMPFDVAAAAQKWRSL